MLDVEMLKMDGLNFLEKLMRLRSMPVVMVSTLTERGSEITMYILELDAIDFVTKLKISLSEGMRVYTDIIADKIHAALQAKISSLPRQSTAGNGVRTPIYYAILSSVAKSY